MAGAQHGHMAGMQADGRCDAKAAVRAGLPGLAMFRQANIFLITAPYPRGTRRPPPVNPGTSPSDRTHEPAEFVRTAVEQFQAPLLRYAMRLLGDPERARDVVQDTFVRLLGQAPATVEGHLAEWLFTVCRNRAFDIIRKEGRMKRFEEGAEERVVAGEPRPGAALEAEETHATVLRLIDRLPPNQQEVVRLKFQNGFSYKEISRITALSVGNVGFLLHTAIKTLRREWLAEARGVE
jgi:RNA polymerase sigma factor (sigma-70 family)